MQPAPYNLGLDLVRAASIVAVICSHTLEWWLPPGDQTTILAAYLGMAGVEAFFSLSGFLIGGILLRAIDGGLGPRALGRFWTRRWMRTLPAYWVLILGLGWYHGAQDWSGLDWRSPFFLQNFVPRSLWTPLTPHTWSLVLEEWFYLFVPVLLAVGVAVIRTVRWAPPIVCALLIAACMAGRAAVGLAPGPVWGAEPNINPILRLDCAAWGVLAAWAVRQGTLPRNAAAAMLAAGGALLVLAGVIWVRLFHPETLMPYGFAVWGPAWQPGQPAVLELGAAMVLLGLHRLLPRGRGVLAWAAGATARLSYALYLVHVPVIYLARQAGLDDAAGCWPRIGMLSLMLGAALILRYGVELPALALRDRLAPDHRNTRSHGNNPSTPAANSAMNAGAPGG